MQGNFVLGVVVVCSPSKKDCPHRFKRC